MTTVWFMVLALAPAATPAPCSRFEQPVAEQPNDPARWRELGQCRLTAGQWSVAAEALEKASSLAEAAQDPAAAAAAEDAWAQLAEAVLGSKPSPSVDALAKRLSVRFSASSRPKPDLAGRLLAFLVTGGRPRVAFEEPDWRRVCGFWVSSDRLSEARAATLAADDAAPLGDCARSLPSALPPVPYPADPKPWPKRCFEVDPASASKCRRHWLACFTASSGPVPEIAPNESSDTLAVLIDFGTKGAWRSDPTESSPHAQPASWLHEWWGNGSTGTVLRVDACAGTVTEWLEDPLGETRGHRSVRAVHPLQVNAPERPR